MSILWLRDKAWRHSNEATFFEYAARLKGGGNIMKWDLLNFLGLLINFTGAILLAVGVIVRKDDALRLGQPG